MRVEKQDDKSIIGSSQFQAGISELIFGRAPEASGPIRQIVFDLPFGVGEYRKHPGARLPRNVSLSV